MTLRQFTLIGAYTGTCYKELITDAGLEDIFEEITGEKLQQHELTRNGQCEDALIHKTLKKATTEYHLHSHVTGHHERMHYAVYQV